jgi:disulfide bond formation protein DsbB
MSLTFRRQSNAGFLWVALLSAAAITSALVLQHVFDVQPCAWCVLLRLIFIALGIVGIIGWLVQGQRLLRLFTALLALALALSGVATGLYLHLVASHSSSCDFTLADKIVLALGLDQSLPMVFKVGASCDAAVALVLGVPSALWAVALSVASIVVTVKALRR